LLLNFGLTGTAAGGAVAGGIVAVVTRCRSGAGMGYRLVLCLQPPITVASYTGCSVGLQPAASASPVRNVTDDIYPVDIYFQSPLDPFTLDEGKDLTGLLVDRYNDFSDAKAFIIGITDSAI
jgi:hypothetical protein